MDVHCCHCHSGFIFDRTHECPSVADAHPEEPQDVETPFVNAARGLVNALPDCVLEAVRRDWGNTNVAVIKHWREILRAALPDAGGRVSQTETKD